MTEQDGSNQHFWGLKFFVGVVIVAVAAIAVTRFNLHQQLQETLQWVQHLGAVGAIAFVGIYALATVFFIPGSILTLGGGAVFGLGLGIIYVLMGALAGATLAFLIGRYFVREWVTQKIEGNEKFQAIDVAVAKEGFKVVLLTRLSPLFPFTLLNYAFGITQVSLKDYILGSIGIVPGTLTYTYIGSLAGSLAAIDSNQAINPKTQQLQWLLRIVGLVATIAVTVYVTRVAQKALGQRGEE